MWWRSCGSDCREGLDIREPCGAFERGSRIVSRSRNSCYPRSYALQLELQSTENANAPSSLSKLTRPSLSSESGPLFWSEPPGIYEATKDNLEKLLVHLLPQGGLLSVTDKALPAANLSLEIKYD